MTHFLLLVYISQRNLYLDSIMRLLPTIKVSVPQNVHPNSSSHDSTKRESHPSPHAVPHLFHGPGIRGSSPSIKNKLTHIQPRSNQCPLLSEHHCPEHCGSAVGNRGTARGRATAEPYYTHPSFPLKWLLNLLPNRPFSPSFHQMINPNPSHGITSKR